MLCDARVIAVYNHLCDLLAIDVHRREARAATRSLGSCVPSAHTRTQSIPAKA